MLLDQAIDGAAALAHGVGDLFLRESVVAYQSGVRLGLFEGIEVLALDPRPAYRQGAEPGRVYGMRLAGTNVGWQVTDTGVEVLDITPLGAD